jgi:hypothetical protein
MGSKYMLRFFRIMSAFFFAFFTVWDHVETQFSPLVYLTYWSFVFSGSFFGIMGFTKKIHKPSWALFINVLFEVSLALETLVGLFFWAVLYKPEDYIDRESTFIISVA